MSPDGRKGSERRLILIGLDFGTSGTKVVFRNVLDPRPRPLYVVDFGTRIDGYSRFVLPSTFAASADSILTGEDAEKCSRTRFRVIYSTKMLLLRPEIATDQKLAQPHGTELDLEGAVSWMSAVFLASVLDRTMPVIESVFPGVTADEVLVNMDIPVSQLDDGAAQKRFDRVIRTAFQLWLRGSAGSSVRKLTKGWKEARAEVEREAPGMSRTALIPESQAIIQGAGEIVEIQDGSYKAVVDIGAGTTDIAWFKLTRSSRGRQLPFFSAGTATVGCDDVDAALLRVAGTTRQKSPRVFADLRAQKASLVAGSTIQLRGRNGKVPITPEQLRKATSAVSDGMVDHYRSMWKAAYGKHKNIEHWNDLSILVAGGGSLLPGVKTLFRPHPYMGYKKRKKHFARVLKLSPSDEIRVVGESSRKPDARELPFLLAALGLGIPTKEMPRPIRPDDISDDEPGPSGPTGYYDYEDDFKVT